MAVKRENIQPASLNVRKIDGKALYSHCVAIEGGKKMIFVAGQLARDKEGANVGRGDMRAQVEQACQNVKACLEAAGATLADVVRTNTYVTDIDAFFKCADIRSRYFGDSLPTSTTVEVRRLAHPDLWVEIDAIAVVG